MQTTFVKILDVNAPGPENVYDLIVRVNGIDFVSIKSRTKKQLVDAFDFTDEVFLSLLDTDYRK